MWNIAAIFGAAYRGATSVPAGDTIAAERFLGDVLRNVSIMDKGARESMLTFEQGVGDAAITYENEVLTARQSGRSIDYVIPPTTLWIETPVAVVRGYSEEKGNTAVAEAFVEFLATRDAQKAFVDHGFRPARDGSGLDSLGGFPAAPNTFTIRDLGGWPQVTKALFSPGALFERAQRRGAKR